jgi:hypothetical protein
LARRPSARLNREKESDKSTFLSPHLLDFLIALPVITLVVVFYFWTALSNGDEPSIT